MKLVAKGLVNHHAKAYEFSHFVVDANPTALLLMEMKLVGCGMRSLDISISNICSNYRKTSWLKASRSSRQPLEFARAVWLENLEHKFDRGNANRATCILGLIHSDISGSMPVASMNGSRYLSYFYQLFFKVYMDFLSQKEIRSMWNFFWIESLDRKCL